MPDHFIDQEETQIYGPYAARKIRTKVVGLIPAFDPGLTHLADEIDAATLAVKQALEATRTTSAALRKGARDRTPALEQALQLLVRFGKHLDSHQPGTVDRRVFFPGNGTVRGIGRSTPRVLLAMSHITGKLREPTSGVKDRESWLAELTEMMAALEAVIEHADNARTDRRGLTPECEAARRAWLQTYRAGRLGVECVLRLTGKLDLLPAIFHDLAVSSRAKVTEPPSETGTPEHEAGQAD